MSQAVVHGGTVYLAGQVSNEPAGDVKGQTAAILAQIDRLLSKCGSDKTRLLSANIYLADVATFSHMNEAWESWAAEGALPARTTIEAKLARPEYLVEITVTAAV
tara:strand:- start:518 stop:832 length:315 start_codon:yes stop_codon:yes gene_type:complete